MVRAWVGTWQKAGPELENLRSAELSTMDAPAAAALESLESAFNYAVHSLPPRPSSGLVEMQRYFAKLPR